MTAQPWLPAASGLPVDLVTPTRDQVDFQDLAHALAHLNRYAGHARTPVSVGLHLLVGLDLCPSALRPWWLLHDAHETRTGELPSPTKAALSQIAAAMFGDVLAEQMMEVCLVFEARHDAAIHSAAGLPLPTPEQCEALMQVDLRALATERRDFLAAMPKAYRRPWFIDTLGVLPGPKVWRPMAPADVAIKLYALFTTHLPALQAGRAA
ncbi:hypothetical protein OPKNFCMD_3865 [Methylobacterium crusticola]|uniref:Metal-dependent phosphohydrolase n=1 Tax=Methylobacterium crusticola TaxID=1697972 RepID=A0ABQ4R1T1_9HYPH|nr:hypothetical protein [Methylobacterium crusticola]GJD51114.1 hypothetical protein OPKNFCMD_3865 [Methylobacterium crusticola]